MALEFTEDDPYELVKFKIIESTEIQHSQAKVCIAGGFHHFLNS